jgi:spermidine synthase
MTWLLGVRFYKSAKNGLIYCRRFLGRWEVFVGGYHESSRYLEAMWRNAYSRLPADFEPRRILMLGLAAGDNVRLMHERWPQGRVTAVEWDPTMIRVAESLRLYPSDWRPEILIADAAEAVRTLPGKYDLILVDVFTGGKVAQAAYGDDFYHHISRLLEPTGLALVNGFLEPAALDAAAAGLGEVMRWKQGYNHMGLYIGGS